jgi:penicillin-binding protein 2
MIDELELLASRRPTVSPPSEEVRAAALRELERAITREHAPKRKPARPRWVPRLGWVAPAVALAATFLIAGGAILLLHRAPVRVGSATDGGARGRIVDRNGELLSGVRAVTVIRVIPALLPPPGARAAEARLLARLLVGPIGQPSACPVRSGHTERLLALECVIETDTAGPRRVTLPIVISDHAVASVAAHRSELPGIRVRRRVVRTYPDGLVGVQVLAGVQSEYASSLRAGETVKLTLDARLERTGQRALSRATFANRAPDGAFVALDPDDGEVLAMGSSQGGTAPYIDRAIQAAGPTGSVFTPITAVAALESGRWLVNDTFDDTGQYCIGSTTDCLHNSGGMADGVLDLVSAIRRADGVFFYNLGARTNVNVPEGGPLQRWARWFGIGERTGIDLPGEMAGTLPTPAWRAQTNELETECENATGPFAGHQRHPAANGGCGIAPTDPEEPWSIADNVNMAVGQGDVQVTPLQLAVAYAALANGGTIVTPHVGEDIQNAQGTVLQRIDPAPRRRLQINPAFRRTILEGMRAAASEPGGTSADVFGDFPEQVYGKTGTAQYISGGVEQDYAWYAGFVPATAKSKPIVVVVWVQRGGFGDVAAAPVARQILSQWLLGRPGPWRPGTSTTL